MQNVEQMVDKIKSQIENFFGTKLPITSIESVSDYPIASLIDHTCLAPTTTKADISLVCEQALAQNFAAVCVPPRFVSFARNALGSSDIKLATVIGFPLGYNKSSTKRGETVKSIENGATEIDMVLPIGALIEQNWSVVRKDIQNVVQGAGVIPVKVILETCYLTPEQIIAGCLIAQISKAKFVKTSTGFGSRGASLQDIEIMHATIGGQMGIKASGGIKDLATAKQMIQVGATRIGSSASMNIVSEDK